jgi:hypothetical protein
MIKDFGKYSSTNEDIRMKGLEFYGDIKKPYIHDNMPKKEQQKKDCTFDCDEPEVMELEEDSSTFVFQPFDEFDRNDIEDKIEQDNVYVDDIPFKRPPLGARKPKHLGKPELEISGEVETEIEVPVIYNPLEINQDLKLNVPSFDPNADNTPRNCSIVKCMTDNGMKVAIIYTDDMEDGLEELESGLSMKDAISKISGMVNDTLPMYNQNNDEYLGAVPSSLVIKKNIDDSTSYKK